MRPKNTPKSDFDQITRGHQCTSKVTLEGSRSVLVVIFESVSIWRFQGEKNVWGSVHSTHFWRVLMPQNTPKSDFDQITRGHQCTSKVTLEGSRSVLAVIFESVSIWRFQGEKNVWGFVHSIPFWRVMKPKNTPKSDFDQITRGHQCTCKVTLEGFRSVLVVIFESVLIWRFQGEKK